ncbi:MAG: hypothetical protein IT258_15270 [Saprospiraceae bacterium]|nr:hypothetical protein [Saprospiraceae bacterium]
MTSGDSLYPIKDAEQLIKGFDECKLPKEEWTHEAHLIGGLWVLAKFGK